MAAKLVSLLMTLFVLISFPSNSEEAVVSYSQVTTDIAVEFDKAIAAAQAGEKAEAQSIVADAYFEIFEGSGMEVAIGTRSPNLKSDLESQFNQIRGLFNQGAPLAEVQAKIDGLKSQLKATSFQLSHQQSRLEIFLSSLTIILREGFEAILIIGAIVAFLIKTNNHCYLKLVASAVWSALVASLVVAILFSLVLRVSAAQQELIEGVTMLLACVVLFTVGHWLVSKSESEQWQKFIRSSLQNSLSAGSRRAIWFTCFLAVFREGAETALFYQALWSSSPSESTSILSGFAVGCVGLAFIYFTFKAGIMKIPMRPFFRATSTLLYYLAFVFAGRAVVELQAGGYLLVHELKGWPTISLLGIYPTLQSVVLQAVFILALIVSLAWIVLRKKFPTHQIA